MFVTDCADSLKRENGNPDRIAVLFLCGEKASVPVPAPVSFVHGDDDLLLPAALIVADGRQNQYTLSSSARP